MPLQIQVTVKDSDILCGRGRGLESFPGNQVFRRIIKEFALVYVDPKTSRTVKTSMVRMIYRMLEGEKMRFVKKDDKGAWVVLNKSESKLKVGHALRDAGLLRKKQEHKVLARLGKEQVLSAGQSNYKVDTIVDERLIPVSKDDEGYGHHVSDYGGSSDNQSHHREVSCMSTEDEGDEGDDSSLDSSTATAIFRDFHHGIELLESSMDSFLSIQDHKTPTLGNDKLGNGYRKNHADVDVPLSSVFLDFLHDKGDANVLAIGA